MKWLSSALLFAFPALLLAHPKATNCNDNSAQKKTRYALRRELS
ncbi:MAG: hypothetical protein ACK5Z2_18200 [Bacteroidota bacterium]|jgi:hypothetical protein